MTIHKVEILCYLENSEILRFNLFVNDLIDEQQFLYKIFDRCTLDEVRQIERISCCQILTDDEDDVDVIPLLTTNSRFWFNSPHPTDIRHTLIKNEYISYVSN